MTDESDGAAASRGDEHEQQRHARQSDAIAGKQDCYDVRNGSARRVQQSQPVVKIAAAASTAAASTAIPPNVRPVRLPSRSVSPSAVHGHGHAQNLRSQPSVGVSQVEAHSDSIERLQEGAAIVHEHLEANGEDVGRDREVVLPSPRPLWTSTHADEPLLHAGISDYTFVPPEQGGLLGRGKFSSVQLAWKAGRKFAVKVTPLYPHHHLIATRLLREPTILAQLPLHPNLVKVYESIRTPGYFYLIEEFLEGFINLENFVASQPGHRLTAQQSKIVLQQLVSVVRSALHQPIQIAHRDIKPENILIHPKTLRITLLDFGLATHFSGREPKLTTCCGSPAFHAPELFLSLKSPPGSVRYWGPEIDIWTIGVTLLRCLTGHKYPLGVSHTSLQHMAEKVVDSLSEIDSSELRRMVAGMLDMDGQKRMDFFRSLPSEIDRAPFVDEDPNVKREFKSTSFLVSEPKYTLPMPLVTPSWLSPINSPRSSVVQLSPRSRSASRDRLAAHFAAGLELTTESRMASLQPSPSMLSSLTVELILLNPSCEPPPRAISFVKYAMRCAGILYHLQPPTSDYSHDEPSLEAPPDSSTNAPVFHCVLVVPKEQTPMSAATTLLNQLRPPLTRAQSAGPRSSSTPPQQQRQHQNAKKSESSKLRLLEFWIQIVPVFSNRAGSSKRSGHSSRRKVRTKSKNRAANSTLQDERECTKIRVRISDEQAVEAMRKALSIGRLPEDGFSSPNGTHASVSHGHGPSGMVRAATDSSDSGVGMSLNRNLNRRRNGYRSTVEDKDGSVANDAEADDTGSRGRSITRSFSNGSRSPPTSERDRPNITRSVTAQVMPSLPVDNDDGGQESSQPHVAQAQTNQHHYRPVSKRGFFDFVSFGRRATSVGPLLPTGLTSAPLTPMTTNENTPNKSQPASPSPLAFAAM